MSWTVLGRPVGTAALWVALALLLSDKPARAQASSLPPELGYNYGELETPRAAAMGGALRALSNSTDAIFINPANMAVTRVYHISGTIQTWPQADRQSYGGAAVDSVVSASRLAGGVAGTWTIQDDEGLNRRALDVRGGFALPFSDKFFGGVVARFLSLQEDGFARDGNSLPPSIAAAGLDDEPIIRDVSFDAGLTVKPSSIVALSLVGTNLTDPGHPGLPLTVGGALGIGAERFSLEADYVGDLTTYTRTRARAGVGGELLVADNYPLRAGYKYDQGLANHALSFGAGYTGREFSADLSVRRAVSGDRFTAVFFGLSYHLEATGIGSVAGP